MDSPRPAQPVTATGRTGDFTPKILTVWREGYDKARFRADALAGLTVAIVALPLAMALAVASGASPEKGLITAVVAGFLISLLGGSRVQIGGPTGAFVVVVFNVIAEHGYDGLVLATMMAGLILIVAGYSGLGRLIKFVPHPVVTGFTAGIAVIIATSQIEDFLGLDAGGGSADFVARWTAYAQSIGSWQAASLAVGSGSLALILLLRRYAPRLPAYLIVIVVASAVVALLGIQTETIGDRFPDLNFALPAPAIPELSLARIEALLPAAFTIAFLAGIEALLSCVVADGMTGFRHRSNQELVGQGVANLASGLFGGLPATGAIARTATNIRSGGRTPVAGILHALFLLLFALTGSALMALVPMATLAAILFAVAWGMSEHERFLALLRMPIGERGVLLVTFLMTVLVDLTMAILIGVTLASLIFIARMSETLAVESQADSDEDSSAGQRASLPEGVEVFQVTGPLFFGAAGTLLDALKRIGRSPRFLILRLEPMTYLDGSGAAAVDEFVAQAKAMGTRVIVSGARPQPMELLGKAGLGTDSGRLAHAKTYDEAIALTRV
ncbi:MAG TPA: SulP family inorganic anion transporter [Allosphingosinicella sp.]|nr:SulP family inorganic anion transporter [Allosphingosinicella sp.]